jgi:D-arabinose 1-dehydrogenase-like Zn-dependent alcohol dehydrogenase
MSKTAQAMQVRAAGGPLELVEIDVPDPGPGEVRIEVKACGICHSDSFTVNAAYPGISLPRSPGHEIAGVIEMTGPNVGTWSIGQRVGVGWFGGADGTCAACRRGDFIACSSLKIPGISYDGGYARYVVVPIDALAALPDELSFAQAAPLLCAGITTYNALRHTGAKAGDLVAVLGIGGLGHLGVQYAAKMGFHTVAIARGADKAPLARTLGAKHYIDSTASNVAEELTRLGGAKVILSTVTSGATMAQAVNGLATDGTLLVVGAAHDAIDVSAFALIGGRKSIKGWPSGTSSDSEDTLAFSVLEDVRPMIETVPLADAQAAYDKMLSGAARFRMVLVHDQ